MSFSFLKIIFWQFFNKYFQSDSHDFWETLILLVYLDTVWEEIHRSSTINTQEKRKTTFSFRKPYASTVYTVSGDETLNKRQVFDGIQNYYNDIRNERNTTSTLFFFFVFESKRYDFWKGMNILKTESELYGILWKNAFLMLRVVFMFCCFSF